ncbi:hypothetical protein Hanom_Chr09g00789411 [Helianthus anomalus]
MWLINCSKKDIDCLFYNKIVYEKRDKVQAQPYQSIVDVCFAQDINSGRYWKTKWRNIEIDEFLKGYNRSKKFEEIAKRAAELASENWVSRYQRIRHQLNQKKTRFPNGIESVMVIRFTKSGGSMKEGILDEEC